MYRQCLLGKGTTREVVWIPAPLARVGHWLRIGAENGWKVIEVWSQRPSAYVLDHERDYRTSFPSIA